MLLAAFIGLILAAAATQSPAHAQPPPPHDLSLTFRHGLHGGENGQWIFTLTNEGQQHAHSGQVKVSFRRYVGGDFVYSITTIELDPQFGNFDPATEIWQFRNLAPGQTTELKLHAGFTRPPGGTTKGILIIGRGEIVSSVPRERPEYLHNNATREAWKYDSQRIGHAAEGNAIVEIQGSEDRFPEANETVDFTVRFRNAEAYDAIDDYHDMYDVRVKLTPSPGLELVSGTAPSGQFGATGKEIQISSSFDPSTGIWDLGSVPENEVVVLYLDMPVTVRYTGAVPLEQACLTAELVNILPPERPDKPHIQRDSEFRICLGEDPTVLFQEGEFDLIEFYPCVGVTAYPCNDQDTLELVTSISVLRDSERNILRDVGIDRYDRIDSTGSAKFVTFIQPESIVLQVGDLTPRGREMDTSGNPFWSTANGFDLTDSQTLLPASTWSSAREDLTVTGAGGGLLPGTFTMNFTGNATDIEITNTNKVDGSSFGTGYDIEFDLEFGSLGTYVLTMDIRATHSTAGVLTNSGIYTFHVGPVAELEVRDAGANPELSSGQRAYTVMAVNNGPDIPPAAQVTLTGVPEGAEAIASQGSYDPASGVWTIGELSLSDFRQASGRPGDGPTLTLITDAPAGSRITAEIENTQDYCVRIKSGGEFSDDLECQGTLPSGYTEHTAKYYDYRPGNNRAVIQARAGTGTPHPDAARDLIVMETRVGNIVTWQPVQTVNSFAVTHYEVQKWAGRWTPMESELEATKRPMYLDMEGRANADYRVRAVSDQGVSAPWSITGRPPDMPGDFTVELSDRGPVLSWTEPTSPSPITGYVIDISDSAEGDSRTNDATVGGNVTTWTHTGLSGGDVKFYRVQARNRDGVGPWTEWQSVSTGPGAPGSLRARANGPSEIVLTWSEASSRDVTIYEYELEYSDTSASQGYEWTFLNTVLHDEGLRYVDNTVPHGTTRYYRVRARTLQGNVGGAWSNVASATTSEAGPSAPLNVSADFVVGNTEHGILLTWEAPASGDASYYRIEHSTDGGATWESESNRHTGTCDVGGQTMFCYTDSGLFSGTEHWYRVAGVNSSGVAGEWARSNSHITQGEPTEAPGEPQNLRITSVSGRQVSLAWDAPADDGGTRVTGYEFMVESVCVHDPQEICQVVKPTRVSGTTRTVTVPNVRGQYQFYVRALNAVGAGWWSQPVGQYIDPGRNWRVTLSPSRLTVPEDGQATYRVRLTSDPGQPVWVVLDWRGDDDLGEGHGDRGIPSLSEQQFKWLLPSNYASRNPEIYLDPDYTAPWNTGVTITVTASEDDDSENGTAEIRHEVLYVPCAELGNPAGCVDDPEDTGVIAYLTVTERDNE